MQATMTVTRISRRPVPPDAQIRFLEKVTGSLTFQRAEQLRRMLRWLGERSMEEGDGPTEHDVGVVVLQRPDFDPQTDSLVRKEMSRLRDKLTKYYLTEGAGDEIRISAGGGYQLTFEWATRPVGVVREIGLTSRPCAMVLPLRHAAELAGESLDLHERLLVCAGQAGSVDLVSMTTALSYAGRAADVRTVAAECGADFVVEGSLRQKLTLMEATLWVVDGRSGKTRGAGRVFEGEIEEIAEAAGLWMVRSAGA